MSLDLNKVAPQVSSMVARLKDKSADMQQRLQYALDTLCNKTTDLDALRRKIASSRTTWLVADLVEGLDGRYGVSPLPQDFTVIATDGSQIDVDRHRSMRCYLINIGSAVIHYSDEPDAIFGSYPQLYAGDEELVITPAGTGGREQPIEGALLGIKRFVDECRQLTNIATGMPAGSSTMALIDGSLILWGLEPYSDFVTEALLKQGFLKYLDEMKKLNNDRQLALASYISFPRSADVVNTLRVAICPFEVVDTDRYCKDCTTRECDAVTRITDREMFTGLLSPKERSDLFVSQSSVIQKHYGVHRVYFFYLRTDDEIARVEIPQWVAMNEELLNLTHRLILDQCRRGHGYPVALSEAHEQAVVTGMDRENFWQLVESSLVEKSMPAYGSAKSFSKRTRWI